MGRMLMGHTLARVGLWTVLCFGCAGDTSADCPDDAAVNPRGSVVNPRGSLVSPDNDLFVQVEFITGPCHGETCAGRVGVSALRPWIYYVDGMDEESRVADLAQTDYAAFREILESEDFHQQLMDLLYGRRECPSRDPAITMEIGWYQARLGTANIAGCLEDPEAKDGISRMHRLIEDLWARYDPGG